MLPGVILSRSNTSTDTVHSSGALRSAFSPPSGLNLLAQAPQPDITYLIFPVYPQVRRGFVTFRGSVVRNPQWLRRERAWILARPDRDSGVAADEAGHAFQGCLDFGSTHGITTSDETFSGWSERISRNNGHLVFNQKSLGKLL